MGNRKNNKKLDSKDIEIVTLEDLLKKYFGLKSNMFLSKPKIVEYCDDVPIYDNMTVAGHKAYKEMINFIFDLSKLGVNGLDEGILVDSLDEITNEID